MRLVIPIASFDGAKSVIFEPFRRAHEFAVVEISAEGRNAFVASHRNLGDCRHRGCEAQFTRS